MILDKYLSFRTKVIVSVICSGVWIYFRTNQCYEMIPREQILPVIFVMIWAYLNYYEPLFLPIGLLILMLFPFVKRFIRKIEYDK
jgi:magnesium-transporting ATPase (P-type)